MRDTRHCFAKGSLLAFALLGAGTMAGCTSTATPYQPQSSANAVSGGYSDVRLAEGRFEVTFAGNRLTSREQVEASLLYRAAELTVEQGYDWFLIEERAIEHEVRSEVRSDYRRDPLYDPWFASEYGYWRPYWRYYGPGVGWRSWYPYSGDPFWADNLRSQEVERFEAKAQIRLGRGSRPDGADNAFDARQVLERIGPSLRSPN